MPKRNSVWEKVVEITSVKFYSRRYPRRKKVLPALKTEEGAPLVSRGEETK